MQGAFHHTLIVMATVFLVVTPLAAGELDPFSHLPGHSRDEAADKLTFTQTQSWDSGCLAETRKTPRFLPANWKSLIAAGPPPRNSSLRVRSELDYLHYPSDTAFGREIARRLVDLWMEKPEFRSLVEKARGEWKE